MLRQRCVSVCHFREGGHIWTATWRNEGIMQAIGRGEVFKWVIRARAKVQRWESTWHVEASKEASVAGGDWEREKWLQAWALETGYLGSSPSSAAYTLGDLGQVIYPLWTSRFSSVKWRQREYLIGLLWGWIIIKPLEHCLAHSALQVNLKLRKKKNDLGWCDG